MATIAEAFWYGYHKLQHKVQEDYANFHKDLKKKIKSDAAKKAAQTRRDNKNK